MGVSDRPVQYYKRRYELYNIEKGSKNRSYWDNGYRCLLQHYHHSAGWANYKRLLDWADKIRDQVNDNYPTHQNGPPNANK